MPIGAPPPNIIPSGPSISPALSGGSQGGGPSNAPAFGLVFVPQEYQSVGGQATANASGIATITFGPVPLNQVWRIQRISVSSASTSPTSASVYLDSAAPQNQVDYTLAGDNDIADEVNPILVASGKTLLIQWVSSDVNAVASARIQYVAGQLQSVPVGLLGGIS